MTRATIAVGVFVALLVLLAVVLVYRTPEQDVDPSAATSPAITAVRAPAAETHQAATTHQGFLYGRIATLDGSTYEGRLRWGGNQEAFWGDLFNGAQRENPWLAYVPPERLPEESRPRSFFGIKIGDRVGVGRLFMVRFGEIARMEARGREVRVTLKSGAAFDLDRLEASDFDDGVRVWDGTRGVVDLESLQIRRIELLPTPPLGAAPDRLHGMVSTRQGDFTGFLGWDWNDSVGTDQLHGRTADGELGLRFDTIRSIARRSRDSSLVTLLDGREMELSGTREVGHGNRGIYVDDERYGRVQISWDAFERVDFIPGGSGPAYGDFPPGRPLTGSVTTRAGRLFAGRLVYDLDESETVETLEASSQGVRYTIPFGRIASIVPAGAEERGAQPARVTLHHGEELQLEPSGDLREGNAGLLVFVDGQERPEYVPWADVERVDFDRPPARVPPPGGR
ncbi:MAG TPA: hypothetical protein VM617_05430 [Thermoanaerobaculia bacterium]|nr:hypothetical protein [Thermoanaerobaculia bacterium]